MSHSDVGLVEQAWDDPHGGGGGREKEPAPDVEEVVIRPMTDDTAQESQRRPRGSRAQGSQGCVEVISHIRAKGPAECGESR